MVMLPSKSVRKICIESGAFEKTGLIRIGNNHSSRQRTIS